MKNILKYSFLVFGVVLYFSASAHAMGFPTPEVDPSLAVGGLLFLAGTLVVLRSRLRK
jgi:hypothetical protein